jgi:hypothetical protein
MVLQVILVLRALLDIQVLLEFRVILVQGGRQVKEASMAILGRVFLVAASLVKF